MNNNCSFNANSDFWNEEKNVTSKINKDNKKSDVNKDFSFEKLKEEIIEYGKNKDFPDIND